LIQENFIDLPSLMTISSMADAGEDVCDAIAHYAERFVGRQVPELDCGALFAR